MQVSRQLLTYKTSPVALRAGVTKGWAQSHSVPEHIYKSQFRNYLKVYHTIKAYLDTQNVRIISFNMVPHDTTTVVSMNIFWYKPLYKNIQSRRSKLFKPWTGWQSRWSRPPLTLFRPRLVQNLTNERKILQAETVEEIDTFSRMQEAEVAEQQQKQQQKQQKA